MKSSHFRKGYYEYKQTCRKKQIAHGNSCSCPCSDPASVDDLKTKDYFQTSAFADNFYSKASAILTGISAREILDKTAESAYIDLGELYNGDSLSFKNTSGLAYSFNDLKEWSSQSITSNDDWIVLGLTTPEGETKYMYYSDFKKALENGTLQLNATMTGQNGFFLL